MKPNLKKKFDFSAEMSEAEAIKATPKNEYLEEEKQLLDINAKELVSLNDNVYKLRTEVENLSDSIHECKPIISEEIQKLAVEFGATLLYNFLSQIESKCKEAERRIKKASNAIPRLCKLNCVMLYSHSISSVGERPAPRGGTTRPDECKITTI